MGDRGQKKTNQMLAEQTRRMGEFADVAGQRGTEAYGFGLGNRDFRSQAYRDLYAGLGEDGGGGGGGGPAYQMATYKDPRENEAMAFYRDLQKTGGYTEPQIQDIRGRATSTIPGFFEGIKRSMAVNPNVGFGSQMKSLAREQGRQASDAAREAEIDIQSQIRQGRERGAGELSKLDEALIGRQMQVERERIGEQKAAQAAASAAANRRAGAAGDAFRNRMAVLQAMGGLTDPDAAAMGYGQQQLAGLGGQTGTITSRVQEQSLMDKIGQGANILGGLAGSAAGAMTGMGALGGAGKMAGKAGKVAKLPTMASSMGGRFGQLMT